MSSDMEILQRAMETEKKRMPGLGISGAWLYHSVGATREDIKRLLDEGLIEVYTKNSLGTKYKLAKKGADLVWAITMETKMETIPAASVMEAFSLIVGFDDLKLELARAIEGQKKANFLLSGPPASAKSMILEGIRSIVPSAYLAFGSRTSSAGLSDALFEFKPKVLLIDEADKVHNDVFSVLLGLMESGEIIETKSKKTRGIKLSTMVVAACNNWQKMPPEFLSRFSLHVGFPEYTRDEFIDVVRGMLSHDNVPQEISELIASLIYDNGLGDVRKAKGAWTLMTEPTEEEARRVVSLMLKYAPDNPMQKRRSSAMRRSRLPGM